MAKCVINIDDWQPKLLDNIESDLTFLVDQLRDGERSLNDVIQRIGVKFLDISSDFLRIIHSTRNYGDTKWDCRQVQDGILDQLNNVASHLHTISTKIVQSKDIKEHVKHRYFIMFTSAIITMLKQFLQTVGRLSDLSEQLLMIEQRNPLVTDESIAIHTLTAIWTASISIMDGLNASGRLVFTASDSDELQDFDFLAEMDFRSSSVEYSKVLLMDLLMLSWVQFNRLVKYVDVLKSQPLICLCHSRYFIKLLTAISANEKEEIYPLLVQLILNHQQCPSMITESIRHYEVVPIEPAYSKYDKPLLAYFVVWHLHSLCRVAKGDLKKNALERCHETMASCFDLAMQQFPPPSEPVKPLSSHQEERLKLLFVMLHGWFEAHKIEVQSDACFSDVWNKYAGRKDYAHIVSSVK